MATKKKVSSARKKRVLSAAQKAALARGRAKMAAKRGERRSPAKRKTSRKKASPVKTTEVMVFQEPKKSKRRKSISTFTGANSMAKKKRSTRSKVASVGRKAGSFIRGADTGGMLRNAALALVGGVASGFLVNKFPVKDARVKAALPIIGGIVLSGTIGKGNRIARGVAEGMVMLGAVSLFKQLAPGVPFLAGEQQYYIPAGIPYIPGNGNGMMLPSPAEQQPELGFMGENVQLGIDEYYSPVDL